MYIFGKSGETVTMETRNKTSLNKTYFFNLFLTRSIKTVIIKKEKKNIKFKKISIEYTENKVLFFCLIRFFN